MPDRIRRLFLILLLLATGPALAEKVTLRLGTLAPKNSLYHRALLEMGEAWKAAQGDGSKLIVFTDGAQGGESDTVKRMRIGQLNGGLLSVVGLREIDPSVSALQTLPLMFRSWDEVDHVREQLRPAMEQRFFDKGYVVLSWGDAGWVRFFSQQPAAAPEDFKSMKMFTWAGEPEQMEVMKALGYQPVSLETADILPALQTGLIEVVPATPYYALAAQFNGPAPYMLELNWAPIVGALVVTRKAWEGMSPAGQTALREAARVAGEKMRAQARTEVDEAVAAMVKRGLKVTRPNAEQMAAWQALAESVYPQIRGRLVPAETFDEVTRLLAEYRARNK
ncbi:TRAP transporter substrate-binding protein DctP [Denitromonas sp.]|uniref:TRAP transporter substrate-binding protein n=1 Tax=Denitromonas sp. TaxID=2734609 RepID=UPI003A85339F